MNFRDRAKQMRDDLIKGQEQSLKSKDDKSGAFGSIFDKTKLPESTQFWKCKAGEHLLDFIPWISGGNHPLGAEKLVYVVDYWAHYNVGPMNDIVACNQYMYRKPCPICEYINKQRLPKPQYMALKAKRRCCYLVWCHDTIEEERKGVQILEISHFLMENNLVVIAANPKGGGSTIWSDPDNGKMVAFKREGQGMADTKYLGFRFVDRDEPIPDHILNGTFAVDDAMSLTSDYDQVKELFYKGMSEPEAAEEADIESESITEDCPGDGEYGVDINKLDACKTCAIWDNCYEESKVRNQNVRQRRKFR